MPSSAAPAQGSISVPGCRPSRRNARAESRSRCRYDQENTPRTAVRGSPPPSSRSSRRRRSPSCHTRSASGAAGRAAASSAAPHRASGRQAHCTASVCAAAGSASTRSPISDPSRRSASVSGSRSRSTRRAPSRTTSPASESRLVTIAVQPGVAGSSGLTCSAHLALSSTTSTRCPASRLRKQAARSVWSAGIPDSGTPSERRKPARPPADGTGEPGS